MSEKPPSEPSPGTKRVYWRPDPDMTDDEIEAWAVAFVDAVLGAGTEAPDGRRDSWTG